MIEFFKWFPSLKDDELFSVEDPDWEGEYPQFVEVILKEDIQKYCLDKQKVKDIYDEFKEYITRYEIEDRAEAFENLMKKLKELNLE